MSITKKYILIVSVIILILLSFIYLDAGIKSSNTVSDSSVNAYTINSKSNETSDILYSNSILLYIDQDNSPDLMMEDELIAAFEDYGYSVTLTNEIKDDYGSQFAFINILEMTDYYTPVYSTSEMNVLFGYSSTGRTKYLDITGSARDEPVVFSSSEVEDRVLLVQGDISLRDETQGFFTYRSYRNHLAKETAKAVASGLDAQLESNLGKLKK